MVLHVFGTVPRRCVFDGFLQDFEAFKGYVRPLSGRLSLAGWAWILLGFPCFACIVHSMFSGPLSSRPKLPPKLPFHPRPLHGFACFWNSALSLFRILPFESVSSRPYGSFSCRFCGFPEGAFSMASYRILRRSKGTLGPLSGRLSLAGWAWILLGFPCFACIVHPMFSGPLSSRPKLPPKLPFHPRPLHGFACFWNGSQKVRFRWLPTGFWGVQRVR